MLLETERIIGGIDANCRPLGCLLAASKDQGQSDGSAIAGIPVPLNLFTFIQCQPRHAAK
jgi:hypothetical protein